MYFKKLELYGFKSFVDKTTLIFEPGVTAIVGPNGVGKSNISDAIKWVLGEQSAKSMRGSKMEDVIFNGTEAMPPVNMAEVSLTLSNTEKHLPIDYDEVTITRRLYRSGESEYLINKTLVRLKDVNELLLGTGIGTESYSLLEQGRIDAILSSKPEERRVVFEEASGITRYKKKKNEALRKLDATEENLLRVNDIIVEVNRQLNSITRAVSKARRYQEQFEQLKELDSQYTYHEYNILKMEEGQFQKQKDDLAQQQSELEGQLTALSDEFENLKIKLNEVEQEYNSLNNRVLGSSTEIEKNRHSIKLNEERVDEFKKRIENLCRDIQNSTKKISEMGEQANQLQARICVFQEDKSTKEHNLNLKQSTIKDMEKLIKETNQSIEKNKLAVVNWLAEHAQLKNELAKLSANIHNNNARLLRLNQEKKKTEDELSKVNAELTEKINQVEELRQKVNGEESQAFELKEEHHQIDEQVKEMQKKIQENKQLLIACRSELDVLEKLNKTYEGFSNPVKSFMLKRNDCPELFQGVYDVLVNMIEVSPGYEICVEAALGEYLQAVVVENKEVSLRAADFLEKEKIGRIRFISADSMPEAGTAGAPSANTRSIMEVINCDEKCRKAVEFILRNTFIIKNNPEGNSQIEQINARDIASALKSFEVLVSPGGEIHSGLELISKPAQEQWTGLISQKVQIKQLQDRCETLKNDISVHEQEEQIKQDKINTLRLKMEQLNSVLSEEKIALANRDSERNNIEGVKKKLDDELSIINLEIDETTLDGQELTDKEQEKKNRLVVVDTARAQKEEEMARWQELISVKTQEREELLVVIAEMKTEFSLLNEQEQTLNNNFSILDSSLNEQRRNLEDYQKEKDETTRRIDELNRQIRELSQRTVVLEEERQKTQTSLEEIKQQRSILISNFEEIQNQIKDKESRLNNIKNSIRDFDVKKVELNFKIESLINILRQSYKVDLSQMQMELPQEIDWGKQKEQIDALKAKIERMGAVNLAAVEEEEELKERVDFLNTQREDLSAAKQSLMHAIQKINRTTKSLFLETFEKSKVAFKEYFKLLFSGGDAQLMLSEDKDVLESGIEIVVRPPGKRLQNITLLSGGEKTLTAIALLFAIFKIKPTPFCLLDEMDAPLDESNIDRFTRVLQEFIKTSQFIIITHNKKTIGMADVMYGVTMEDAGISKLVSVKFSEYKENEQVAADAVGVS